MDPIDAAALHTLAVDVRQTGTRLQEEADALRRRVEAVPWQGRAAEAMRVAVGSQLVGIGRAAQRHEDAADALDAHAVRVAETSELLPALGGIATWWAA